MTKDDVYDGILDVARFGAPVVGPVSDDKLWLVNPLSYDPTRPTIQIKDQSVNNQLAEMPEVHSLSSPQGGPSRSETTRRAPQQMLTSPSSQNYAKQ